MKRRELTAYILFTIGILYCIVVERNHFLASASENIIERPLPAFTELMIDIPCQVRVHTQRVGQGKIIGDDALLDKLNLSSEAGVLYIRLDEPEAKHWKNFLFSRWESVTLDVYMPSDEPYLSGPAKWLTFKENEDDGVTIHSFGLSSLRIGTDSVMSASF